MAFDQPTRNRLARFVSDARRILTDEFTRQCKQDFGIDPDTGEVSDVARLTHLNDTQRATARILRETLDHYVAGSPSGGKKASIDRILREQAFTTLNRLCAVRMAEARGIVIESVSKGPQSKGFSLYARVAGSALGETADAYRGYLFSIFDELALDLPPLFDRFSPKGRLFPSATALDSLLSEINDVDLDPLWGEDETIGWLYQYFNSVEERKQMRDESSAPRNSRELAVRNQFFTPRYVVEFLTDNTLGRIWYEMAKGETVLKDACRYLVRRPSEVFLAEDQTAASQEQAPENLSQQELLKQPVYIPHRPLKDPREIRLLDPACGSMHFGLYAFDLFITIYDEAWELALGSADAVPQSAAFADFIAFASTFPDKTAFLREVPQLIIEHNIHGIDIDPRAVQIAGLSLWLRAQRAWHQSGVKPAERPRITRSRIVCAEPMPGEKALLQEFVRHQFQEGERPVFANLLEQIFDQMKLAGEAGSLLRIEESIRTSIVEAKRRWQQGRKYEQSPLFPEAIAKPDQDQMRLDLLGITDEQFWERAEQRIYEALKSYSEKAENVGGFQRRLFVNDAAQGFAFIDLCRKHYDVVVMNPPFGEASESTQQYLRSNYPEWNFNLFCCFVARALDASDFVGAITDRAYMLKTSYEAFRRKWCLDSRRLTRLVDLGWGVLDANVEVNLQVFEPVSEIVEIVDLCSLGDQRSESLAIDCRNSDGACWIHRQHNYFLDLPNAAISYQLPAWQEQARNQGRKIVDIFATAKSGLKAGKVDQFVRLMWEVPEATRGTRKQWNYFQNGGPYSPFYYPTIWVLKYDSGWQHIKTVPSSRITGLADYWLPGLSYGKRTDFIYCYPMPEGQIFSNEGMAVFPNEPADVYTLLGFVNSPSCQSVMNLLAGQHKAHSYFNKMCLLAPIRDRIVAKASESIVSRLRLVDAINETSPSFCVPIQGILISNKTSIIDATVLAVDEALRESEKAFEVICHRVATVLGDLDDVKPKLAKWDELLFEFKFDSRLVALNATSYCLGAVFGRWDVRYATGEQRTPELPDAFAPLTACPPGMLQSDDGLPLSPEAGRKLRAEGRYPFDVAWDGVLVDDENHALDIERRVRAALVLIWGDSADAFEHEVCSLLGVATLREWFRHATGFFADHQKRYSKSRRQAPIYLPLSTPLGSYTLWLYYHRLTDQSLFKAVNDFVEPKLQQIASQAATLRGRTSRSSADNAALERLSDFQIDLTEFRNELLRLAKVWKPNLNDGVVITAAPLWKLFQYKPWQKKLKETWESLEAGEYDWAHLAYSLWPERVREKCKRDKSLAIAHGLEELYQEPPATAGKKRGRKPKALDPELLGDAE